MGLVNAVYSWPSVKAIYFTVFSMNLAGLVALAIAIFWAVRFERGFGDYLNLITPGDGHVWTAVIISAAICCSPAYVLGIKCWLYLKLEPSRSDLDDQNKLDSNADPQDANRLLFVHVIACLLSGFLVAFLNATYLLLLSGFQQKSRDGLAEAIEKYSNDIAVKARMDAVQTELECCGDNSYEDWFRVPWLKISVEGPEDVGKGPLLEEQSVTEEQEEESNSPVDVPFSCCSNDIPKPCIHHDILSPSAVYDYNPKHLTISTKGCRSKIISRGEVIRVFLAGYLALLSVYQMILSFVARLLQTAHSNELHIGPQKTRYHVWIFSKPKDFPANYGRVHRQRKRTKQRPPSSSLKSSDEEEISSQRRKNNSKSSSKVLTKIRSKISHVKSKSLPAIRPVLFSNNSRSKKRGARKLPEEDEEEENSDEERELLPRHAIKSEVAIKRDRQSLFSLLSDNSSTIDLPPPPPPPPFAVTFNVEDEQAREINEIAPPRSSKAETKVIDAFDRNVIATQNSGRRIKVLERFGRIWERKDRATQHRESGGADDSCSSRHSVNSNRSIRKTRTAFSRTDIYDRFRGTLQHTLARREAVRARRERNNIYHPLIEGNLEDRRGNILAKLRYDNVPPSYRLLANIEIQKRPVLENSITAPTIPPLPPPPPPPLPPPPSNLWSRNSTRICASKTSAQRQRQCSICNRPVRQSPSSSRRFLGETREEDTGVSVSARRRAFLRHADSSRGDYASRNRSTRVSREERIRVTAGSTIRFFD